MVSSIRLVAAHLVSAGCMSSYHICSSYSRPQLLHTTTCHMADQDGGVCTLVVLLAAAMTYTSPRAGLLDAPADT
jgi:hypothetical protein